MSDRSVSVPSTYQSYVFAHSEKSDLQPCRHNLVTLFIKTFIVKYLAIMGRIVTAFATYYRAYYLESFL
jgi:hypothetical protein